jgi:hypothetical protein
LRNINATTDEIKFAVNLQIICDNYQSEKADLLPAASWAVIGGCAAAATAAAGAATRLGSVARLHHISYIQTFDSRRTRTHSPIHGNNGYKKTELNYYITFIFNQKRIKVKRMTERKYVIKGKHRQSLQNISGRPTAKNLQSLGRRHELFQVMLDIVLATTSDGFRLLALLSFSQLKLHTDRANNSVTMFASQPRVS